MENTPDRKVEIRKEMARRKCAISLKEASLASLAACERMEWWEVFRKARLIVLYHSLPDEFPTAFMLERFLFRKEILLPVIRGGEIHLCLYTGKESVCKGRFSITEPVGDLFLFHEKIDLCVVPGIAFDHSGNRLGRGKGYYDRLLTRIPAPRVGLCYECQYVENLPVEAHDIRMDYLITEHRLIQFKSGH